jgi:uncharacterized protein
MTEHPSGADALFAAIRTGGPDEVAAALTAGPPLDARDADDWSPLERAAGRGDEAVVRLLLAAGADPTSSGRERRTAYEIALAAGHLAAARLLRQAEEDADPESRLRHAWRPYCRGYRIADLREFDGWREAQDVAGLGSDEVVYVHDDLTVTRSVWPGEEVVFADRSEAWARYCRDRLGFRVLDDFDLLPPG